MTQATEQAVRTVTGMALDAAQTTAAEAFKDAHKYAEETRQRYLRLSDDVTRTKSEGQLCPACVEKGHRVENDTLIMNMDIYLAPSKGTSWTLFRDISTHDESAGHSEE